MPYTVRRQGEKWIVVKKSDGKKVGGTHSSKKGAIRQLAAIEMSEKRRRK